MAETSPLRRRMIEDMTVRNLSPATQRSYVHAVSKFSRFFGRSPATLTLEDVRTFQVHLASKGVAWASLNQTVAALRFFHGVTLGMAEIPERIAYAREPGRLPVVLSADEVVRFLEAVSSLKTRSALTTAYAAGLRVSEVVGLRVGYGLDLLAARDEWGLYISAGREGTAEPAFFPEPGPEPTSALPSPVDAPKPPPDPVPAFAPDAGSSATVATGAASGSISTAAIMMPEASSSARSAAAIATLRSRSSHDAPGSSPGFMVPYLAPARSGSRPDAGWRSP